MKNIIVFGMGTFGKNMAVKLSDLGAKVSCVDIKSENLISLRDSVYEAQIIDCTDERAVKEKLLSGYDVAVIGMHQNFSTVLLLVIYLKESKVPHIIARAETAMQKSVLEKLNVEEVIMPEYEMGMKVAERLVLNNSEQLFLTREMGIVHIPVPRKCIGKSVSEIFKNNKYGLKLLLIRREYPDQDISRIIEPNQSNLHFTENDHLVISGNSRKIARMLEDNS